MIEKHDRLFRFRDEVDASYFVEWLDKACFYDRVWIGPFVRVAVDETRLEKVEYEAKTRGGRPVGEWGSPVPSVEKLLAGMEGWREIYGGVPEDEDGACVSGGIEGAGRVGGTQG